MTDNDEVLGAGRFLRLRRRNGWELVERPGIDDIAVLIAVTSSDELVLADGNFPADSHAATDRVASEAAGDGG